ncbi:MAG: hypothetical protein JXA30_08065 [Deltaproteobacteria bacterium]|nr:hypothetical protein [Deltaproteobacteria bacterium]
MTSELRPLIQDASRPAYVRELIRQARSAKEPRYDFNAGLLKHKALIASGAPLPAWAKDSVGGITKSSMLIARIVGVAAVPIVGAMVVWGGLSGMDRKSEATQTGTVFSPSVQKLENAASDQNEIATTVTGSENATASLDTESSSNATAQARETKVHQSRRVLHHRSAEKNTERPQAVVPYAPATEPSDSPIVSNSSQAEEIAPNMQMEARGDTPGISKASAEEPAAPPDDTLLREMALLGEARRLLDRDPARALTLSRAREPKTGILSEEWDQVNLLALIKLGRIEDAREGVKRFLRLYPNSAFNERLRKEIFPLAD